MKVLRQKRMSGTTMNRNRSICEGEQCDIGGRRKNGEGSVVVGSADSLLLVWKNGVKVNAILAAKSWHVHASCEKHRKRLLAAAIFSLMAFRFGIVAAPQLETE
jgi:hypothetical protein